MRRIRSLAILPLAAALILSLGGCFEMEETMVLRKDGSGTMTVKMVLDTKKMEQVKAMMEGMFGGQGGGMDGGPMDEEDFDLAKAKAKIEAVEGLKLVKAEPIDDKEAGKRGWNMVVEFKNLEALAKSGLWDGDRVVLSQAADGTWTFEVRRVAAEQVADMSNPEAAAMKPMIEGMFGPFLDGLKMTTTWVLPGRAGETNGKINEEGHVTWTADFKAIFGDIGAMNRKVSFKGDGIALTAFEYKTSTVEDAIERAGGMGGMGGTDDDEGGEGEGIEEDEEEMVPSGR